jgi:hypothetical protein
MKMRDYFAQLNTVHCGFKIFIIDKGFKARKLMGHSKSKFMVHNNETDHANLFIRLSVTYLSVELWGRFQPLLPFIM